MSNHKTNSSREDQAVLDEFKTKYEAGFDAIEKAKQVSIGDFLILHLSNETGAMVVQKNTYGAPVKYKVVHLSKHGIPFLKRVNKKGTPIGKLYSIMGSLSTDSYRLPGQKFEFSMDPDYADAILLEDPYDPSSLHRSKKDIFKAVTDHNKTSKVKTESEVDCVTFFNACNIGDTIWTSHVGYFLIQDKKVMVTKDFNAAAKWNDRTRCRAFSTIVLTVRDKNGKVKDIAPDYFWGKTLYKDRPRSYKELNI